MDGQANTLSLPRRSAGSTRFARLLLAIGLIALTARVYAALCWPDDTPSDAQGYQQLARNLLEHHVYSSDAAPPFTPNTGRVPGYPVFLASLYALLGTHANTAVRVVQAFFDAGTCALTAWLASLWAPRAWRLETRRRAVVAAAIMIATCPFVAVYLTTILTETLTTFTWMVAIVATTRALDIGRRGDWLLAGVACGAATSLRPDSGLLVAACGGMLLLRTYVNRHKLLRACAVPGLLLGLGFGLMLAPWTIHNAITLHAFLPIPHCQSNLSADADEVGYGAWLNTWVDDFRYVEPLEWKLDSRPIVLSQLPESAFDSEAERARVAQLLFEYNHPASGQLTVRMTPALDAGFAQLARERRARHPFRQHVALPLRRACNLWFDTHSDFYWFAGQLRTWQTTPAPALLWRALFMTLTWFYTLGAALGGYLTRRHSALWFTGLIAAPRLWFLGQLENPEPRYVIELFPVVIVLCALGLAYLAVERWRFPTTLDSAPQDPARLPPARSAIS